MVFEKNATLNEQDTHGFRVIHPLDDVTEEKFDPYGLGVMQMTRTVGVSLMALRGYLVAIVLLVFYHVLDLAGLFTRNY